MYIQEYVIKTQRGPLPERSWRVSRRYNDFVQLNATLSISGFDLPLPSKRIIGNMEPDFIAQRQIALQVHHYNIICLFTYSIRVINKRYLFF